MVIFWTNHDFCEPNWSLFGLFNTIWISQSETNMLGENGYYRIGYVSFFLINEMNTWRVFMSDKWSSLAECPRMSSDCWTVTTQTQGSPLIKDTDWSQRIPRVWTIPALQHFLDILYLWDIWNPSRTDPQGDINPLLKRAVLNSPQETNCHIPDPTWCWETNTLSLNTYLARACAQLWVTTRKIYQWNRLVKPWCNL